MSWFSGGVCVGPTYNAHWSFSDLDMSPPTNGKLGQVEVTDLACLDSRTVSADDNNK